jgi:hypothetical protein
VTNCHILACVTLAALIPSTPTEAGANTNRRYPITHKIRIPVTPGVKSFLGEGKANRISCIPLISIPPLDSA